MTGPDGEGMGGVTVSARAEGAPITTSVLTDEAGRLLLSPAGAAADRGRYRVWAQAVGSETASGHVDLDPARRAARDFTLAAADDFTHQLSGVEWLDALPAESREDRRLKEVFRVTCTECHQAGLALQNRFDERGWRAIIDLMGQVTYHGWGGRNRTSLTMEYYRDEFGGISHQDPRPGLAAPDVRAAAAPKRERLPAMSSPNTTSPLRSCRLSASRSTAASGLKALRRGCGGAAACTIPPSTTTATCGYRLGAERLPNARQARPATGQVTGFKLTAPNGRRARNAHRHHQGAERAAVVRHGRQPRPARPGDRDLRALHAAAAAPRRGQPSGGRPRPHLGGQPPRALRFDPDTHAFTYYQNKTIGDGQTYGTAADRLGNGWWAQFNMDIVGHANGRRRGRTRS